MSDSVIDVMWRPASSYVQVSEHSLLWPNSTLPCQTLSTWRKVRCCFYPYTSSQFCDLFRNAI